MENRATRSGWRFRVGVIVFLVSFLSPALIPLVAASNLSVEVKATLSGFLALGIPEIGVLIAVAIMGKPGYDEMKRRFFGWLKHYGPPAEVGRTRYRLGLVMFAGPILFAWLQPYAASLMGMPEVRGPYVAATGDVIFILSFFVLGGDFWDKVRSLFIHAAKVTLPEDRSLHPPG